MKATLIVLLILIALSAIIFGPRICKDIKKKQKYANTFAIQNVKTGKDIRVYNAGIDDETQIILYSHHNWECITWQLIELEGNTYLLKNLYTQKTFEPASSPQSGVSLWQQPLGGSRLQYWEFVKQPDETYLIRLKDTQLYLTATSNENNFPIVLMPKQDSDSQQWRLLRQNPII
jgi:hypothetical protein